MHLLLNQQKRFWIISFVLFVSFVFFLNTLDSGSYKFEPKSQKINDSIKDSKSISVYVQLKQFDSVSQTLKARIWIYPPKKYSVNLGSSVQVLYDTRIQIDSAKLDSEQFIWAQYEYLRGIDIELDATNSIISSRNNDKWFPFDRYSVPFSGQIDFRVEGSDTEDIKDDVWKTVPTEVTTYTANLPGWSSEFSYQDIDDVKTVQNLTKNGFWLIDMKLERTSLNVAILFLIGFIFIAGGLSMLMLFRSILMTHRPPTLSGLAWSGTTAFTMIQTRTVIPGSPRIGVKFDLFIFYPALALCFISSGLMFYYWLTKDSWSREM